MPVRVPEYSGVTVTECSPDTVGGSADWAGKPQGVSPCHHDLIMMKQRYEYLTVYSTWYYMYICRAHKVITDIKTRYVYLIANVVLIMYIVFIYDCCYC